MAKKKEENISKQPNQCSIATVCDQLEKKFGKGALIRMGDRQNFNLNTIASGSLLLDEALGCGGYPCGRIIEVYGPESSGKTTLTLHAIAECQRQGGTAAFIDAEHALDPIYASHLGVQIDDLWLAQPDYGEQALEIVDSLVRSEAANIIVIDSVAALIPQVELNGEMGEQHVGLQARLMSQALRKLAGSIAKSGAIVFFINQIRMKIGVVYGNPEVTSGGNALKFYSSIRLEVRRGETLTQGSAEAYGCKMKIKVAKNKVAPPFRRIELELVFGKGLSYEMGLLDAALKYELVQKAGSWFSWGETRIGQGRDSVRRYFSSNPELAQQLEVQIRERMSNKTQLPSELSANTLITPEQ